MKLRELVSLYSVLLVLTTSKKNHQQSSLMNLKEKKSGDGTWSADLHVHSVYH